MKTWNQLFIRHGWMMKELEECAFDCRLETEKNLAYLQESLDKAEVDYSTMNEILYIHSAPVSEQKWIEILDFPYRGRGENMEVGPGNNLPGVSELDTFIAGIVRQLNRLGFQTAGSCDGHIRRRAHVMVTKDRGIQKLKELLTALGLTGFRYHESTNSYNVIMPFGRKELLDLAEKLSFIELSWLEKGTEYMTQQMFNQELEQLLSIPGESGHEEKIRQYVAEKMLPFVDYMSVDRHGNLLAEKIYNSGNGPTILLNAHLDTVCKIEPSRVIQKEDNIWTSSEGILGADDRAGVAILLQIAQYLNHSSFNGKVKYVFTVEEEIGLVGAERLDAYFLWGTDAAMVVDRRGSGDIVVSCNGYTSFCDTAYGEFFETVAAEEGLSGWRCTDGGSSDTRIWAEHGIQSVNLSAGYMYEHTGDEYLDVEAAYETVKLIKAAFNNMRELRRVLREINRNHSIDGEIISLR